MKVIWLFAALAVLPQLALAQTSSSGNKPSDDLWMRLEVAQLQGLDKITARVSTFLAPIGQPVRFGTLVITARACRKRPPTETPESVAFLEIDDRKPGQDQVVLFKGWMFASSPALNALEHPVYDVWVLDCESAPAKQ